MKLVMQTHRAPLPLNSVDSEVEAVDAGAVHIEISFDSIAVSRIGRRETKMETAMLSKSASFQEKQKRIPPGRTVAQVERGVTVWKAQSHSFVF